MPALRIGINALYMIPGGVGGTEIYLRSLLLALDRLQSPHEFFVFINTETEGALSAPSSQFQLIKTGVRATNRPQRLSWEQMALPGRLRHHRIDVLLNPGFTAPVMPPCPSVTVFHDLQHVRHPEYFRWFDLPFWRLFLYAAARRSALIVAVSEATRQDFIAHYKFDPSRVRVVHHGVDAEFFGIRKRLSKGKGQRYILTVSTLHPHKNFRRLLLAYAEFIKKRPDIKLVIAGLRGFEAVNLESLRAKLGLTDAVEFTGWIAREKLYDLYGRAWAFIYPSTFEGFGLPVVEALAAGIPTACSRIDPLSSMASDAALQFDPHDDVAMIETMKRIVNNEQLRTHLSAAGPQRAALFSWKTTARLTLEALLEAAQNA